MGKTKKRHHNKKLKKKIAVQHEKINFHVTLMIVYIL